MGQCEIGWALRPSARVLAQGQMSPCPTSHLGNYEQNDAKMPQNNSVFLRCHKKRQATAGDACTQDHQGDGQTTQTIPPAQASHPHLVTSFKEPAGQGHLFLVSAPSSCQGT